MSLVLPTMYSDQVTMASSGGPHSRKHRLISMEICLKRSWIGPIASQHSLFPILQYQMPAWLTGIGQGACVCIEVTARLGEKCEIRLRNTGEKIIAPKYQLTA